MIVFLTGVGGIKLSQLSVNSAPVDTQGEADVVVMLHHSHHVLVSSSVYSTLGTGCPLEERWGV